MEVSEKSNAMYNSVLKAHDEMKQCEKEYKVLVKDIQNMNKEKEEIEKRRTDAIKLHAQVELDVKDLEEKNATELRAKVSLCLL